MQPPDPDTLLVLREWIERADADLHVAEQLAAEAARDLRVREIVGFHCQQAAEKYLKALLTRYQIEFPKTHDLRVLLDLRSEEHTSELQSLRHLVCRLLLEKKQI